MTAPAKISHYYTHRPLGEPVVAIGGSYRLLREVRLGVGGRELLYLVGAALVDSSCCGAGGCGFALVQGYVRRWQALRSADGLPLTEVEPVADEEERRRLTELIQAVDHVQQVTFRRAGAS